MKNMKLLVAAIVLIVIALVLQQSKKPTTTDTSLAGTKLVKATEIDKIKEISIKSTQGNLNLKQINNVWRLPELHGLKADLNRIEEFFQKLNNAKIIELVSKNPKRHKSFELETKASDSLALSAENAQISLADATGKSVQTLFLGKGRKPKNTDSPMAFGNDGQYFRYSNSDEVYLLSGYLWLDKTAKNWVNKDLLKQPAKGVKKLSWNYTGMKDQQFEVARTNASESLTLSQLSKENQTKSAKVDNALSIFANLQFDEFIATTSGKLYPKLANGLDLQLETFDKLNLTMKISSSPVDIPNLGKGYLVWLNAEYSGTDEKQKLVAKEIANNSQKLVFGFREHRLKNLMVKKENLQEPKPVSKNASATADTASPAKVSATHILIAYKGAMRSKATRTEEEAKKLADELLAKIKKGESIEKLAKENSDCPSGKSKKGSLGEFPKGVMAKEFEETAFSLKVGEISKVVKTEFGYHIIRRDK